MTINILERALERVTGKPVEFLRSTPVCEMRRYAEKMYGKSITIGDEQDRRNGLISHEEVESVLSYCLDN